MPTYVKPTNDESRRLRLNKAAARAQQDAAAGQGTLSPDRATELAAVAQRFDAAIKALHDVEDTCCNQSDALAAAIKALKNQVQQAWKAVNGNIASGVWASGVSAFYPVPREELYPRTPEEWTVAAKDLLDGDAQAVTKGYSGLATRPLLQTAYDSAKEALDAFTEASEAQTAARKAIGPLRDQSDEMIKTVMGDLRYLARQQSPADIRRLLRAYGAQFRYKQNEPVDAEDSGAAPPPPLAA